MSGVWGKERVPGATPAVGGGGTVGSFRPAPGSARRIKYTSALGMQRGPMPPLPTPLPPLGAAAGFFLPPAPAQPGTFPAPSSQPTMSFSAGTMGGGGSVGAGVGRAEGQAAAEGAILNKHVSRVRSQVREGVLG